MYIDCMYRTVCIDCMNRLCEYVILSRVDDIQLLIGYSLAFLLVQYGI